MIIDFHTHIFPPSFVQDREQLLGRDATFNSLFSNPKPRMATAEDLLHAMDEAEIGMAVVMGIGWTDQELARCANDYILEVCQLHAGRLVPFCSVNPSWGEAAVQEVERCAIAGARGIGELHPDTQGLDITSQETMAPLMEVAARLDLLLLTHSSEPVGHIYAGKGNTSPDKLYRLVKNFPRNRIVLAHWGGGLPFYCLMPEVEQDLANVYFDTAATPFLYRSRIYAWAATALAPGKVLFGTDHPLLSYSRALRQVDEAQLYQGYRQGLLQDNAAALLGL